MKKRSFILILILLLASFTSCRSVKETTTSETVTETVKEKIISYKDTIFKVPEISTGLSVSLQDLIKEDLNNKKPAFKDSLNPVKKVFKQQNGRAKITLKIEDGQLKADCECDSIALRAQIKTELIKESKQKDHSVLKQRKVKTGISIFQLIFWCFGWFCFGSVITYILKTIKII